MTTPIDAATDPAGGAGLLELERRVAHDLACLNYPAPDWLPAASGPDGQPMLDVLVVGGGMCGQTVAFGLLREGVRRIRVVDRAAYGEEGPWATFARMDTLRSPKHLTSPDLGVPSLTYRAWHEARHGVEHWQALHKIDRLDWLRYLLWVRRMTGLPIENRTELRAFECGADGVRAHLAGPDGEHVVHARKLVLALGREGSGRPRRPEFPSLPASASAAHVFHSADPIDFAALRGRRIAVLGAGASAFDNAGVALETGAREVTLFARRPYLPQVNKSKWTAFPGCLHGFGALDDDARWRFYTYIFDAQVPPPWESVQRCDRHPNFSIRLGEPWHDLACDAQGVTVDTPKGRQRFDAAILATGFDVDLHERSELASLHGRLLLWGDRVGAARAAAHPEVARFPYLGPGFELLPRPGASVPGLERVHLFNWGSTISQGALAGDIPGLSIGTGRLVRAIVTDLFGADATRHWERLLAFDEDELAPTRWFVPVDRR
jgi:cation diffusion facilitator CzcD-associated flavoprotein CzcO